MGRRRGARAGAALAQGGTGADVVVASSAPTIAAIPTLDTGERPRFIAVNSDEHGWCKAGYVGDTILEGEGFLFRRQQFPMIVNVSGYTHFLTIGEFGADGILNMIPLANQ